MSPAAITLVRVAVAAILVIHGVARAKLGIVDDFAQAFEAWGFPFGLFLAWGITVVEIVGGLALAAGWGVRPLALWFMAQLVAGIVLVHGPAGWFVVGAGRNGMEFSVLLIVCLLAVAMSYREGYRFGRTRAVRTAAVVLCVGLCAGPGAAGASAQTTVIVAGVADANTGAPLEGAQVRLPDLGLIVRTDWMGEAIIRDVPRTTQRIQVRKLGYSPSEIHLPVRGDSTGPVFMLERAIASLDTVRIEGELYPRRMQEYYTRQKRGVGRFLSDSVLAKEGHREMNLVVSMRFPGLRAAWDNNEHRYKLMSTRHQAGSTGGQVNMSCPVDIYLDGVFFGGALEGLYPSDLEGVEYYPMTSAPPQYRRSTGSCSVLLAWSRF